MSIDGIYIHEQGLSSVYVTYLQTNQLDLPLYHEVLSIQGTRTMHRYHSFSFQEQLLEGEGGPRGYKTMTAGRHFRVEETNAFIDACVSIASAILCNAKSRKPLAPVRVVSATLPTLLSTRKSSNANPTRATSCSIEQSPLIQESHHGRSSAPSVDIVPPSVRLIGNDPSSNLTKYPAVARAPLVLGSDQ